MPPRSSSHPPSSVPSPEFPPLVGTNTDCYQSILAYRQTLRELSPDDDRIALLNSLRRDLVKALCLPQNNHDGLVRTIVDSIMCGTTTKMTQIYKLVPERYHHLSTELIVVRDSNERQLDQLRRSAVVTGELRRSA